MFTKHYWCDGIWVVLFGMFWESVNFQLQLLGPGRILDPIISLQLQVVRGIPLMVSNSALTLSWQVMEW